MDIHIQITAPELVKAITLLAEALDRQDATMKQYMVSASSKEQELSHTPVKSVTPPVSEPVQTEQVSESKMDVVELRKQVTDAIKANRITNANVRSLLDQYNSPKLTDLDQQFYVEFLRRLFGDE